MTSSTDVSVNQTRSVMLMLLNDYQDFVIFATNFIENFDPAFMRRISTHIKFELPDYDCRLKLWKKYIPAKMPHDIQVEKLAEKYPHLQIAGMVSPPFRELSEAEDKEMVDQINASGADIIWVGLGAPKQEKWMYAHKDHVNGVMIGVGAGFDYHAGNIKRAPGWMQKLSLEWLYRLLQDPKRLFKRYLVTNTRYLWLIHRK